MTKLTGGHRALLPVAEVRRHFASYAQLQYAILILAIEGVGADSCGTGSLRRSKRYCWVPSRSTKWLPAGSVER